MDRTQLSSKAKNGRGSTLMNRTETASAAKSLLENKSPTVGYRFFKQEETKLDGSKTSFYYLKKRRLFFFWTPIYRRRGNNFTLVTFSNKEEARKWILAEHPPTIKTEEFSL
jgi:hypothetical protein